MPALTCFLKAVAAARAYLMLECSAEHFEYDAHLRENVGSAGTLVDPLHLSHLL